jgi:hypothetical protein
MRVGNRNRLRLNLLLRRAFSRAVEEFFLFMALRLYACWAGELCMVTAACPFPFAAARSLQVVSADIYAWVWIVLEPKFVPEKLII